MEEDKERRNAIFSIPDPNPNCIEVGDTAFSVETVKKTVLPKNTLTFVEVFTKMNAGIGFFKCKENNAFSVNKSDHSFHLLPEYNVM